MSRLPPPPAEPAPQEAPSFPLLAVLAPLGGAVLIGAITGSPYVLVFAILSPVIAVASMLDGRRTARRRARQEAARFEEECRSYSLLIDQAHRAERAQRNALTPARPTEAPPPEVDGVRVGVARSPSDRAPEPGASSIPSAGAGEHARRRRALLEKASWHPALPVIIPRGEVAVHGAGPAARALAARLRLEPGVTVHEGADQPTAPGAAPPGAGHFVAVIEVHAVSSMTVRVRGQAPVHARPEVWSAPELARRRRALEAHAARLPEHVDWSRLAPARESSASIPIGWADAGAFAIDPESQGPHILIGGTTGSGKSEFLRALVLGWAHRSSPSDLSLLFVDFKGGASFPDLATLPHALEVITDLDEPTAVRAITSLRAEIQRRERGLRERGARDIRDPGVSLGRLVIVIDEYAALLAALPELHSTIIDLAARGRSLGIHLVLCTQHPGSAVRDAIAANCAIRVSFRIAESADSGMLGAGHSARLRALPPGRAVVSDASGTREVQTALIAAEDVAAVCERWSSAPRATRLWQPPLPRVVTAEDVARESADEPEDGGVSGWAFGLADRPELLRRTRAVWSPETDGPLAVVGAPGSGRTGALAALAAAARADGASVVTLATEWVEAEAMLGALRDRPPERTLLVADDVDDTLRRSGDERAEVLRLWDDAAGALRRRQGAVVASFAAGSMQQGITQGRFPCTLELDGAATATPVLRTGPAMPARRDPPGRALWRGVVVQVMAADPLPDPEPPHVPEVVVTGSRPWIVIARRPRRVGERIARAHPDVVRLAADESTSAIARGAAGLDSRTLESCVVIDDPEGWTTQWSALQELRRSCPVLLVEVAASELRSLLGIRERPPSLREGEVWLLEPEAPLARARWAAMADDDPSEVSPQAIAVDNGTDGRP